MRRNPPRRRILVDYATPAMAAVANHPTRVLRGDFAMNKQITCVLSAFFVAIAGTCARAEDTLRLTVGQRGLWDTAISEVGQRAGIFKKHGLALEILWTQGSGETQPAGIGGSVA